MIENNNDYITINTKNGIQKQAELISKFEILGLGEYVIYKLEEKLYGAKYEFDGQNTKLITNLTDEEKDTLNEILLQLEVK